MSRRHVIATPMMKVHRATPKGEFVNWGPIATRKTTTEATSARLIKYRGCVAGKMKGASGSLKNIQEKFRDAAHECKGK